MENTGHRRGKRPQVYKDFMKATVTYVPGRVEFEQIV